jgi:hypothetical protein
VSSHVPDKYGTSSIAADRGESECMQEGPGASRAEHGK